MFIGNMLLLTSFFFIKEIQTSNMVAMTAFQMITDGEKYFLQPRVDKFIKELAKASSGQRVVDYTVMTKSRKYNLSKADYEALLQIVQAEASCEDEKGKMLVAGVVLNRVEHQNFPDSVVEVVMQQEQGVYQFSPVADGTYNRVEITQETIDAVERVLQGENVTQGALYFAARKSADPAKMKWFDCSLVRLFQHGGHEFFSNK